MLIDLVRECSEISENIDQSEIFGLDDRITFQAIILGDHFRRSF
jgi:hypothetical protein